MGCEDFERTPEREAAKDCIDDLSGQLFSRLVFFLCIFVGTTCILCCVCVLSETVMFVGLLIIPIPIFLDDSGKIVGRPAIA